MIVLCLHPFTPLPDFSHHSFLFLCLSHHNTTLSFVCAHVCVCGASVHVRVPPEKLMCWRHSWKDRKSRDSSFCYTWFVCFAVGQSCRSPQFLLSEAALKSVCVCVVCVSSAFICAFKQGLHVSGCFPCECVACVIWSVWWFDVCDRVSGKPQMKSVTVVSIVALCLSKSELILWFLILIICY